MKLYYLVQWYWGKHSTSAKSKRNKTVIKKVELGIVVDFMTRVLVLGKSILTLKY
jgi:hypothetical protein